MIKSLIYGIVLIISNLFFMSFFNHNKKNIYILLIMTLLLTILCFTFKISLTCFCILFLINNIILIVINKKEKKRTLSKIIYTIFILLSVSIFTELSLFNFRSYISLSYKSINIDSSSLNTNIKKIDDNTYIIDNDEPYIEINNINKKINNIYLSINNSKNETYYVTPYITDGGNELYQRLESREISNKIEKSKTLNFNLSGKSKKIRLEFTFPKETKININDIIINYKIPIKANVIRICLLFLILLFIYFFRPKSILYKINYNSFNHKTILIIGLILLIITSFSFLSINSIRSLKDPKSDIYISISNRLIQKKVFLKDNNNSEEILNKMKNPYDTNLRDKIFKEKNKEYLWDCAFYKGKYYSYFGVVPAVLFYIPYKLITGNDLATPFLIYVISIISAILLILLLNQVVKKFFKNCSLGLYIILSILLVYSTGLLYGLKMADQYIVPIISGLMLTYLGLNILLSTLNGKHEKVKIFIGALALALVAGCRPQLIMGSFLIIPIGYIFIKNRYRTKRELIIDGVILLLPYIIVAGLLMYYNYIRFDSVFDFGANYNLTTNDMTSRGFKFDRIPLGIMMYLFNPVNIKNVFPFIVENELSTTYLGITIYEPIYGGIFFSSIITSINLFIFKLKKQINNKLLFNTCILLISSSIIIIIADTEMAGILARYINDFLWLMIFSSILIILAINNNIKINKKLFLEIVFVLISITLIYQGFYFFVSIIDKFKSQNLRFWLEFYYTIQFWL